ncbi:hypothetical protein [Streptomyces tanashiensis]|uniref:hypothetical protein n=1 Tax=Streptomyces tanashiensis TaxID=67367 RepID=UPI00342DD368
MTALRKPLTSAAILSLAALLTAGCTGGTTPSGTPSAPDTKSSAERKAPAEGSEEDQGRRAKAALVGVSVDDPEFLASGLERVQDGVHDRSVLEKGETYKLSVACVGTGTVNVVIADKAPESVPCDGVPTGRRVENAPERLPIDINAAKGATGMVAWQIVSVPS